MKRTNRSPESLNRPDGNDLESNYSEHDVAEEGLLRQLPSDVDVYPLGIDERADDGNLIYDDELDFLVSMPGGSDALVDVKAKTDSKWMRFLNQRHYNKYLQKADEYDLPAYVFFANTSTGRELLCRVDGDGRVFTTDTHDFMLSWPDGNKAAYMTSGCDVNMGEFIHMLSGD